MKVYQSFSLIWTISLTLMVKLVVSYEVDGFEHMYELGKEAYSNEEWTYCAKFMEAAVKDYREHQVRSANRYMFFQHELPIIMRTPNFFRHLW